MTPAERTALVNLVSATIHERAQGDPERLAREIVDRIEAAGFIVAREIPIRNNPAQK